MARARASKRSAARVNLKFVKLVIPAGQPERDQLNANLEVMGYEELMLEPYAVKSEDMVREFQGKRSIKW